MYGKMYGNSQSLPSQTLQPRALPSGSSQIRPLQTHSWPSAIMHIDSDAFFAACEQAMHPQYRGKPVVCGKERGIVAAASYEAKAYGVTRGVRLSDVERLCPEAIIVPSDYEAYSLYSLRMFEILRRYSPVVEENSIDEAFINIDGLRRTHHASYYQIIRRIQRDIYKELWIPVSVGVSLSKTLAKVASNWNKPKGSCMIPGKHIHYYLSRIPINKVWNIGPNTAAYCRKLNIYTAYDFAACSEEWIRKHFSKPFVQTWQELNGNAVHEFNLEPKTEYQSIMKGKTFTPPSTKRDFVYAQMVRNLEGACIKARRHQLVARRVNVYLKTQEFRHVGCAIKLSRSTNIAAEIMPCLRIAFGELFTPGVLYRATRIVLSQLIPASNTQMNLFDEPVHCEKMTVLHEVIDDISQRFGKHTVTLASSLPVKQQAQHEGARGDVPWRKGQQMPGETHRQRVALPMLDISV